MINIPEVNHYTMQSNILDMVSIGGIKIYQK